MDAANFFDTFGYARIIEHSAIDTCRDISPFELTASEMIQVGGTITIKSLWRLRGNSLPNVACQSESIIFKRSFPMYFARCRQDDSSVGVSWSHQRIKYFLRGATMRLRRIQEALEMRLNNYNPLDKAT
ncbi:hypothetical protein HN011_009178, partial [Eciton burchellii]|jgi:hypothetical protein